MRRATVGGAVGIAFTFLMAGSSHAQIVKIWPGVAPGSEHWTQQERTVENTPLGTVIDAFHYWLEAQGFTTPAGRSDR